MADLTVPELLDRIHAINDTITMAGGGTLTAFRYWPRKWDTHMVPAIVPLLQPATYDDATFSDTALAGMRQVKLMVPVDSPNAGILNDTAQINAELVIDPIIRAYRQAPYLELSGTRLDGIWKKVAITQDTGITLSQITGRFQVDFTLVVPVVAYQSS